MMTSKYNGEIVLKSMKLSDSQPSVQQVLAIALETSNRKRKKRYGNSIINLSIAILDAL